MVDVDAGVIQMGRRVVGQGMMVKSRSEPQSNHSLKHKVKGHGLDHGGLVALGAHKVAGAGLRGQALDDRLGLAGGLGRGLGLVVLGHAVEEVRAARRVLHVLDAHVDLLLHNAVLDALVDHNAHRAARHVVHAA